MEPFDYKLSAGRFFNLLLWPLKRVWRTFVVRQVVPALLGAKVAVLWPTLFVLVGLFESALAGLLFFYFLFSSAVSLPTASPKIDLVSPLKPQPPLAQYWWYEQPTAEPYRTISQEDVELMESTQGSSFLQNETKYESSTNFVEEKSTDSWAFKTNDNPQVTYYSAYTN
ncbi:Hypothetical predicted protein [Cloeon dipterum]|uniref:Uncharacterized protein n=1 Tax=Cloeon dipterum TaxID=197152 RepID=A0A8S1C009_9INSE|nr:Hypothetical predicted protein [Cloeon dipterum]